MQVMLKHGGMVRLNVLIESETARAWARSRRAAWPVTGRAQQRVPVIGKNPKFTEWDTDSRMAGDRGDARTGLWSRDRGVGT